MESRFRLSSISETEELIKIRHEIDSQPVHKKPTPSSFGIIANKTTEPLDDDSGPDIAIVTGAYQVGKVPTSCEDAYFISERGFGVADGVSGWNDYGFSSSLFATQLMDNCKAEIDSYITE